VNCFCIYCILFESAIVHYKLQICSNCSYILYLIFNKSCNKQLS